MGWRLSQWSLSHSCASRCWCKHCSGPGDLASSIAKNFNLRPKWNEINKELELQNHCEKIVEIVGQSVGREYKPSICERRRFDIEMKGHLAPLF